ncbi:MAG TPA: hypothetical protein VFF06_29625 [Polyangia bacterium]|nr:hypothetical protein [Polyangia bacterium]
MAETFRNDYFSVDVDRARGLVTLTRSAAPFPSLEAIARIYGEVEPALARETGLKLLFDLRQGPPGRNDPEFERAIERWRKKLSGFSRQAILVRSMAGKLQVQRLAKQDDRAAHVFTDEREALRYLGEP